MRYNVSDNDKKLMGRSRKSYKGQTFNRLTIMEDGSSSDKVLCQCVCGNHKRIRRDHVINGNTKSCGCLHIETARENGKLNIAKHGLSYHPLYPGYINLIHRCHNPHHADYERYGALGVTVCDRWRCDNGLEHFIEDKFDTWFEGAELDKDKFAKPNQSKCYSPETTCWLTREENLFVRHNSELYPITRDAVLDPFISYKLATS